MSRSFDASVGMMMGPSARAGWPKVLANPFSQPLDRQFGGVDHIARQNYTSIGRPEVPRDRIDTWARDLAILPNEAPTENKDNYAQRLDILAKQTVLPNNKGSLPFPIRKEVILVLADSLLGNENVAGTPFDIPFSLTSPTVRDRLKSTDITAPIQRFEQSVSVTSGAITRLLKRGVALGIAEFNYYMAMQVAQEFHDTLGEAQVKTDPKAPQFANVLASDEYKRFFDSRTFANYPAKEFDSFFCVGGVKFDETDTHDMEFSTEAEDRSSRATSNIIKGPARMLDYTSYSGVTENASISLVIRPQPVTVDTKYFFASTYDEPPPVHDANKRYSVPPELIGTHTIYPLQIAVLCWPDGGMPPASYRKYTSWPMPLNAASDFKADHVDYYTGYNGLIIKFADILFRSLIHANGRTGYTPPPRPNELRPVLDMRPAMQRPPIDVLVHEAMGV